VPCQHHKTTKPQNKTQLNTKRQTTTPRNNNKTTTTNPEEEENDEEGRGRSARSKKRKKKRGRDGVEEESTTKADPVVIFRFRQVQRLGGCLATVLPSTLFSMGIYFR